jgi:uncharacterized protein (TIGR02271 family)
MQGSQRRIKVFSKDGFPGTADLGSVPFDEAAAVAVRFGADDECLSIPVDVLNRREDGSYFLPLTLEEARNRWAGGAAPDRIAIPVAEERLALRKRRVETGRVRVAKTVSVREEEVDEPLVQETIHVERVAVNRPVAEPVPVRYEGDTLIIPIFEETVVLEKRLVLKEELRVTRRKEEIHRPQRIALRREEAAVERLPADPAVPAD